MIKADYIVVGSGLTGATIARLLADAGREVVVVEKRPQVGGNVVDFVHESGIWVHKYGPHHLRANQRIWDFLLRFSPLYQYEYRVVTMVKGMALPWPVTEDYLVKTEGKDWRDNLLVLNRPPANFEEACLTAMPGRVYRDFVRGYTEKMWATSCTDLSPQLAGRFRVNPNGDRRFKPHRLQGFPSLGYSAMMRNMLEGIYVIRDCDYLQNRGEFVAEKMLIYTGPIDLYYGERFGKLRYRGQERSHRFIPAVEPGEFLLTAPQINYPALGTRMVREIEWKQIMPEPLRSSLAGTVITSETPYSPWDPDAYEYPTPHRADRMRSYRLYRNLADEETNVLICGRLGEYKYLDMDQAIARAMLHAQRLLGGDGAHLSNVAKRATI